MNAKEIIVYSVNAAVVIAAFGLVFAGKITWEAASVLTMALLVPSAAHVAMQRKLTK